MVAVLKTCIWDDRPNVSVAQRAIELVDCVEQWGDKTAPWRSLQVNERLLNNRVLELEQDLQPAELASSSGSGSKRSSRSRGKS